MNNVLSFEMQQTIEIFRFEIADSIHTCTKSIFSSHDFMEK